MKRTIAGLVAMACCTVGLVFAEYSVTSKGTWPESWPKELEHLRQQSQTYEGPVHAHQHYQIPFTKQAEFEAAWPHLLKVKSEGAQLILVRAPYTRLGRIDAGVFIHSPPLRSDGRAKTEEQAAKKSQTSESTTYIELIVDGKIVDLNRIQLPADTPIVDQRFDPPVPAVK